MARWKRVAAFFPTDAGYLPFGSSALRGLNALTLALAAPVALLWGAEGLGMALLGSTRGSAWLDQLCRSLAYLCLQVPVIMATAVALNLTAGRGAARRALALAAAWCAGTLVFGIAWAPAQCLVQFDARASGMCDARSQDLLQLAGLVRAGLSALLIVAVLALHRRGLDVAAAVHETRIRRLNLDRQESEVRLRSLQAQIEPHFLFNTLAHIQRLHEVDAPRGASMLDSLIAYLRSAMPQMRETESTLGRELALTLAYAHVQQIRMGGRLRLELDVPDALHAVRVPSMMVLTLVENAVKHGLSPKAEGGTVRVHARAGLGSRLEVTVSDDGVGLSVGAGAGLGLANTRARLQALHGTAAGLEIGNDASGRGVVAVLWLPLEVSGRALPAEVSA